MKALLSRDEPRVLIVPGLRNSGPAHWQSWLQDRCAGAVRVEQADWQHPDLPRWSERITATLAAHPQQRWVAVAHSFGCLALAHHLLHQPDSAVQAALLVAPAEPGKFGVAAQLPQSPLDIPATLVLSETDPWMTAASALRWAQRWSATPVNLGDAGHVNTDSGYGPWPLALRWVTDTQSRHRSTGASRAPQASYAVFSASSP